PPDVPDRWWEHGSCRSVGDPDAWFPVGAPDPAVIRTCDACPVQTACLTVALTRPERDGVWGGITHRHLLSLYRRIQRIRMRRRGYRARPWHSKREGAAWRHHVACAARHSAPEPYATGAHPAPMTRSQPSSSWPRNWITRSPRDHPPPACPPAAAGRAVGSLLRCPWWTRAHT